MKPRFKILFAILIAISTLSVNAKETLRSATEGKFLMGVALNSAQINERNPLEAEHVRNHFSSIVAENSMKSGEMQPVENQFKFEEADKLVALAQKNNQKVIGHCLIWHSQLPRWFMVDENNQTVSAEVLKQRMRTHIHTVVGRYKGKIKGYDVVNEAFEDNGSYRNSKFYQILGKDFIKLAFQYAHEADPDAELYYNDYSMAGVRKCDAVVEMVKELKAAGCRIDAVGLQCHINMDDPSVEAYETTIKKLAAVGVKVMITEWDISILPNPFNHTGANISDKAEYSKVMDPYKTGVPADVQAKWNKRVLDMFALFLKYNKVIDRVTVWGLGDKENWKNNFPVRGRTDYPVLFDRNSQPKPVVEEMIKMAKNYKDK